MSKLGSAVAGVAMVLGSLSMAEAASVTWEFVRPSSLPNGTALQQFWEGPTDPTFSPRVNDVQIDGVISIDTVGNTAWFGLVDKALHDTDIWTARGNGAYIHVSKSGVNEYTVGTSDGKGAGGEYTSNARTISGYAEVNFSLIFGDGTIDLTLFDNLGAQLGSTIIGTYGSRKIHDGAGGDLAAYDYSYAEFEHGAYLAAEFYHGSGDTASASINAVVVPLPAASWAGLGMLGLLAVRHQARRRRQLCETA